MTFIKSCRRIIPDGHVGRRLLLENPRVRVWEIRLAVGARWHFHRHALDYFWTAVTPGMGFQHRDDGQMLEGRFHSPGIPVDPNRGRGRLGPHQPLLPQPADADHRRVADHGLSGRDALTRLLDRSIDGVLVTTATRGSPSATLLQQRGLPMVLLNRYIDGLDVDRVVSDNHGGGLAGGRFLLGLGHERIGMIRGPANTSTSRDRMAGFVDARAAQGVEKDQSLVRLGSYGHQSGYQHARELLRLPEPHMAIFCGNDVIASGALDGALSLRVRVPQDLSILGFDDIPMASWEVFQLSTLRQPFATMARAAARMLVERIEHHAAIGPGREQLFATCPVKRATVDRHRARP